MTKPKIKNSSTGKTVEEALKKPGSTPRSFLIDHGASTREYSPASSAGDVGSEWDIGVFEIFDNTTVVGLLYVTNPNNDLTQCKEYWGLGPSYTWPSETATKTYKYQWSSTLTLAVSSPTTFKGECDKVFGSGNSVYIKSTNASF